MREHSLEFIEPLRLGDLISGIIARGGSQLREHLGDVHRHRFARAPHRVLMNHVARNGKQISLRTSNALIAIDAQQTQEHLLRKVRDIRGISEPHRQKAAQSRPIAGGNVRDETPIVRYTHSQPLVRDCPRPLERFPWESGYADASEIRSSLLRRANISRSSLFATPESAPIKAGIRPSRSGR